MPLIPCPDCGAEVSTSAPACPKCGRPIAPPLMPPPAPAQVVITQAPSAKKKTSPAAWGCLALIVLVIVGGVLSGPKTDSSTPTQPPAPSRPDPQQSALAKLKLDFTWKLGGFDNVILATFTVKNGNDFDVKDIQIRCEAFGKSGTKIDRNTRTIFDVVKAKKTKQLPEANLGLVNSQAHQLACEIVGFARTK